MHKRTKTPNNINWDKLFKKYKILAKIKENEYFIISAKTIKEFREPRLMVKFDHKKDLPKIFIDHNLAILPVANGKYIISQFDAYQTLETSNKDSVQKIKLSADIQSFNNIFSETIALNYAFAAGIFDDFLNDGKLYQTVSGKMLSGKFEFNINTDKQPLNIIVDNARLEIDAAIEGDNSLALIEAKLDVPEDFIIRQLYYPYRLWITHVSKQIRPIFFSYSNSIFRLYEYKFNNTQEYNSLKLVKQKKYSIEDTEITIDEIDEFYNNQVCVQLEPSKIPFPQADSFPRIIVLCEMLSAQNLNSGNITEKFAFTPRQTQYYTSAGRYLGLIEKRKNSFYALTEQGRKIMRLNYKEKQFAFCKCILQHEVFYEAFKIVLSGNEPQTENIISIMKNTKSCRLNTDEMYKRRAETIKAWIKWIYNLSGER
ncbi:hypothetical protein NO1_1741 [Candidatus Termititenax aidoneus]|uniref:Uncharacterized protein n=1 Tax=Termititenax aidoneus TaxID=2218524 RepID=A0A388TDM8_TERA1|nr:hypothetical protein NO1_1741 [Candidatus Termititenax aidoneus]